MVGEHWGHPSDAGEPNRVRGAAFAGTWREQPEDRAALQEISHDL